jgi:hypothetical protein
MAEVKLPISAFSEFLSLFTDSNANVCSLRGCVERPSAVALSYGVDGALRPRRRSFCLFLYLRVRCCLRCLPALPALPTGLPSFRIAYFASMYV